MSEAVQLAFITMLQSWGDNFIKILPTLTTAAGTAIVLVGGWWIGRTVKKQGEVVVKRLGQVEAVAVTSAKDADERAAGAERNGVKMGIDIGVEKERKRASDFGTLRSDFKPMDTNTFMAGPEK